jgi:general secretion pathway protein L
MIQRCLMSFFRWWFRQLAGLVSARLLRVYVEAGEVAVLEIADDTFVLHIRRRGVLTRAGNGALPDLKQAMDAIPNLPPLRALRIPERQVLRKRVSLPPAVRRDLANVLVYEIDRETPFEQAEVYWNYSLAGQTAPKDRLDVDLVVVPRRVADALADTARAFGFFPTALEADNEYKRPAYMWLETPNPLHYFRLPPRLKPFLPASYAAAIALLILPFAIQQARLFLADKDIAAVESQARAASALNLAANRRMAALAFMGQSRHGESALAILAAATRALPDDTFLTAFTVHGGQVTMAGSSEAAAKLIGALAASRSFRDPAFDSAVLQSESDDLEKFTITAKLATQGVP